MKSIILLPYFGKLPKYFPLHVKTCSYNPRYHWMLFTDDDSYKSMDFPNNFNIVYMTFAEMREKIQKAFEFTISLDYSSKLCDFRPAFGYIFKKEVEGYDVWGHADLDVIWGHLDSWIDDSLFEKYEKVFAHGHLTLYRNNRETNSRFMKELWQPMLSKKLTYRDIFTLDSYCFFDESNHIFDIHKILQNHNIPFWASMDHIAEILPPYSNFQLFRDSPEISHRVFLWERGRLFDIHIENSQINKKEYAYLHFPDRDFLIKLDLNDIPDTFLITPDAFQSYPGVLTIDDIKLHCENANRFTYKFPPKSAETTINREIKNALTIFQSRFNNSKEGIINHV